MLKRACVVALSGALAVACGSDRDRAGDTQGTSAKLAPAGFPRGDIQVFDGVVYTGLDAAVSLQASREMLVSDPATEEQYRTTNLVSTAGTTICANGAALKHTAEL